MIAWRKMYGKSQLDYPRCSIQQVWATVYALYAVLKHSSVLYALACTVVSPF